MGKPIFTFPQLESAKLGLMAVCFDRATHCKSKSPRKILQVTFAASWTRWVRDSRDLGAIIDRSFEVPPSEGANDAAFISYDTTGTHCRDF